MLRVDPVGPTATDLTKSRYRCLNYSDPFGLCPYFLTGKPCSTAAAIGIGFIPVAGDAVEIAGAVLGRDLLTGESLRGLAVGATIAGTLLGSGKLAREGVELAFEASSKWGRNRLVKELHDQGFVLDRPTKSGGGLLYRNAKTGEEIRMMPRPAQRFRNDPSAKHESEYYYRYRSGPDQPWGPHTSIPDR